MVRKRKPVDDALDNLSVGLSEEGPVTHWLTTGSPLLDLAVANQLPGGFAAGRVTHVFGMESTAKSILAQVPLGAAQRQGGLAVLVDTEYSFDAGRATTLFGVDVTKNFELYSPATIEELHDKVIVPLLDRLEKEYGEATGPFPPSVVAVDSLSALPSQWEQDHSLSEVGQGYGGTRPKQVSASMRKLTHRLSRFNVALILIDQARMDVTSPVPGKITTSGGKAPQFYAATRIQMKKLQTFKNAAGYVVGVDLWADVIKNKIAPPFRSAPLRVVFDYGIDWVANCLQWLKDNPVEGSPASSKYVLVDEAGVELGSAAGLYTLVQQIEANNWEDHVRREVVARWKTLYQAAERKPQVWQ